MHDLAIAALKRELSQVATEQQRHSLGSIDLETVGITPVAGYMYSRLWRQYV